MYQCGPMMELLDIGNLKFPGKSCPGRNPGGATNKKSSKNRFFLFEFFRFLYKNRN